MVWRQVAIGVHKIRDRHDTGQGYDAEMLAEFLYASAWLLRVEGHWWSFLLGRLHRSPLSPSLLLVGNLRAAVRYY
jgi:hypothetical protein